MAETEVLIIGCGIAGATAALRLARDRNRQITIITRAGDPHESNTRYAQGGIIGRGPDDNPEWVNGDESKNLGLELSASEKAKLEKAVDDLNAKFANRARDY